MKVYNLGKTDFVFIRHWFRWYLAFPPFTSWQRVTPLQRKAIAKSVEDTK